MKIKKEAKPQLQKLPKLRVRYTLVVPLIGILDTFTMLSFYRNPATDGNMFMKAFYIVFALVGVVFACWGALWNATVDGKMIRVNPVIGRKKAVPFEELKKVVIHKKSKSGSLSYYELFDKDSQSIVKIYPLMKESSALLERFKRLQIKIEEIME